MRASVTRFGALLLALFIALTTTGCGTRATPAEQIASASAAAAHGDFTAALNMLQKVLEKEPNNWEARLSLARLMLHLGDAAGAQSQAERAGRNGAPAAEIAPLLVEVQIARAQYAQALTLLNGSASAVAEPQRSVLRGKVLNALGRPADGQAEFERVLATKPDLTPAIVGLAESRVIQGNFDAALAGLEPVLKDAGANSEARMLEARVLLQRGQFAQAETSLTRALSTADSTTTVPLKAYLTLGLAESQLAQGKIPAADKSLQALVAIAPDAILTRLFRARLNLAKGNYLDGVSELQRLVVQAPDLVQARMALGAAQLAQGNLQQAERQLARVVQDAPDNVEARKMLARVQLQLDQPDAALRALSPALEGNTVDPQLAALAGVANLRAGKANSALEVLQQNVKRNPGDTQRQLELAMAYLELHRAPEALTLLRSMPPSPTGLQRETLLLTAAASQSMFMARSELDRLLAAQPDRTELKYLAAAFYASQREFERARALLRGVLDKDANDTRAILGLANIEATSGNIPVAEELLRRAIKVSPGDKNSRLMLARLFLSRGEINQARPLLDEVIASTQGNAESVYAVGMVLLEAQRYEEALARLRRAADLDPTNATYWLNTARAQVALNQPSAARESAEKALSLREGWMPASAMMVLLDLRTVGPAAALNRAQILRTQHPGEAAPLVLEGDIHMSTREYAEAQRSYESAEKLTPDAALAVKLFDAIRLSGGTRPEAPLNRWLGLKPEDTRVRMVLAQYYMNNERNDRATGELEMVNRQMPDNSVVLNNLAWLYSVQNDPRAETTARRAYELASSNPLVMDTYGWILVNGKKAPQALPILEAASKAASSNSEITYHRAAALAAVGRPAEAQSVLTKLLSGDASFPQRHAAEDLLERLRK